MSHCISLPGIKKVWYVSHTDLPDDVIYKAVVDMPITLPTTTTEITLKGEATCELEESPDNNCYIEKVKLNIPTLDDVPLQDYPAFVIQTVDGTKYVIGAKERPYPAVKITRSTGRPDGDPSVRKYEVSFTAKKALALCSA